MTAIIINGTAKEVADLAKEVQGRQKIEIRTEIHGETIAKAIHDTFQGKEETR